MLRKWLLIVLVVGVLGYFGYDFVRSEMTEREFKKEREIELAASEKYDERMAALEERDRERERVIKEQGLEMVEDGLALGGVDESDLSGDEEIGIGVGMKAPNFMLETMDGEVVSLADFRGKKVLLNFWATWCPPCRDEVPDMVDFYDAYGDDVEIVAVNTTYSETNPAGIQPFLDEFGVDFTVVKDEDGLVSDSVFAVHVLPTSYIINRDGIIMNIARGPLTYELMEQVFGEMK